MTTMLQAEPAWPTNAPKAATVDAHPRIRQGARMVGLGLEWRDWAAAGMSAEAPISPEVRNHQPRDMFDSTALRAPSRSVPVACMYNLTACNLSPAALARQSRAVWHGSEST